MQPLTWTDKDGEAFEIVPQDSKHSGSGAIMAVVKVKTAKSMPRARPPSGVYITRAQARELVGWLRLVLDEEV